MVFHELFDPVEMTRNMKDGEFLKYVEIREKEEKTSTKKLEEIKMNFYYLHRYRDRDLLNEEWKKVEGALAENAGLAEFTLDYDGAMSEFFFPWLVTVRESPSAALEMAYGYGYDLLGNWKKVPEKDPIYAFVQNDPTFVFDRERQLFVADLVTRQRQMFARADGHYFNVMDLGAGQMAWARYHGFLFPWWQRIYAYDKDMTIHPDRLFPGGAEANGVQYYKGDIMESFGALPAGLKFDVAILQGVASYYPMELFKKAVIIPVYENLEVGGVFFFDLQLDCPYYRRSVAIFNWPKINLAGSVAEAISSVEDLWSGLRKDGMKFSVSYQLDSRNNHPSSVMMVLTKL